MPERPCAECQKPCISWCHYCKAPFCLRGPCIEAHDRKCSGFHDSRLAPPPFRIKRTIKATATKTKTTAKWTLLSPRKKRKPTKKR